MKIEIFRSDTLKNTHYYGGKTHILKVPLIIADDEIKEYAEFIEKISLFLPKASLRGCIGTKNEIMYITVYEKRDRSKHWYFYKQEDKIYHKQGEKTIEII